jgi:hypothetical protein
LKKRSKKLLNALRDAWSETRGLCQGVAQRREKFFASFF